MRHVSLAASVLLFLVPPFLGQDQPKIMFHVTSVRKEEVSDYCPDGKCSATRLTAEGYTGNKGDNSVVEYVLECIEVVANQPTPHFAVVCDRVHAHQDYMVRLDSDSVVFPNSQPQLKDGVIAAAYMIKEEREARSE